MNDNRCKVGRAIKAKLGQGLFTTIFKHFRKKSVCVCVCRERKTERDRDGAGWGELENNEANVAKCSCLKNLVEDKH